MVCFLLSLSAYNFNTAISLSASTPLTFAFQELRDPSSFMNVISTSDVDGPKT